MSLKNLPEITASIILALMIQFIGTQAFGQTEEFRVISGGTNTGIGYVNIGVIGKNTGTVTDESGKFTLGFTELFDDDTLRFSMIGYESATLSVNSLKKDPSRTVILSPKVYELPEMKITYPRGREITLGIPVVSQALRSGFAENNLGYELGIKINSAKKLKLKEINFNVGICTFDSVTYRLNVYQLTKDETWENILSKPVYISFRKDEINKAVTFNLNEYSIYIKGETIVTLELYRDMGEGRLLFLTQFFTGTTWHRKTRESEWTQSPGQVGMYLRGQQMK